MLPSLNLLKTFEAAARHASFKQAAAELNVSATAVSHQMRKLEDWLGVRLFERQAQGGKGVSLSPVGQQLFANIHQPLRALEQSLQQLKAQQSQLCIHTTSAIAALWLLSRLEQYQRSSPELCYQLLTTESIDVQGLELSNEISLRFGDITQLSPEQVLRRERYGLYHTPSYIGNRVYLPVWKQCSLSAPPWAAFLQHNNLIATDFECQTLDMELLIQQQAIAGRGMAFLPSTFAQDALDTGLLTSSQWAQVPSSHGIYLYQGCQHKNANVQQFIGWLRTQFTPAFDRPYQSPSPS